MRSRLITAAIIVAAIMLGGCPNKRTEPVPGPQSAGRASGAHATPEETARGRAGRGRSVRLLESARLGL
jgi:hypothetical protein